MARSSWWNTSCVIPTLLLVGLVVGRRWAVLVGAVAWAVVLFVPGTIGVVDLPLAAGLAAANIAVGVLARRVLARALRVGRRLPAAA
jgi:hypothetical protein